MRALLDMPQRSEAFDAKVIVARSYAELADAERALALSHEGSLEHVPDWPIVRVYRTH